VDGLVTTAPQTVPVTPVSVFLPGGMVTPQFVGAAPGLIAGITQINVQIPPGYSMSGNASVTVNTASAPLYITQ
jgi:uncharacterized protein (TIGR03437 family)